jgi:GntR family transcriptional regulator, transcriptional repressor for pyruvate dehydrogenase complex
VLMPLEIRPQRKRLTEDVKETLLGWIRDGKFPSGSQLPSVPELVRKLEVSRTVIREALQAMVGMSLVEIRPGLGCFVKSVPSDLVVNADVLASLLGMEAIVEVVAARKVIESGVARLAAVTATEEDFEEIEEILRKIERAARRNQPLYSLTPQFHIAVARATHNKVLEKIVSSFNLLMASGGALIEREKLSAEYSLSEYESHRELYEAIRSRDPDHAQHVMESHVMATLDTLKEISHHKKAK